MLQAVSHPWVLCTPLLHPPCSKTEVLRFEGVLRFYAQLRLL